MSRIRTTFSQTRLLETDQGDMECPAEPYFWGGYRGTELNITAELLSTKFGGLTLIRSMAVTITGGVRLGGQEKLIADKYAEAHQMGHAE
jgi:hypothetical protein